MVDFQYADIDNRPLFCFYKIYFIFLVLSMFHFYKKKYCTHLYFFVTCRQSMTDPTIDTDLFIDDLVELWIAGGSH